MSPTSETASARPPLVRLRGIGKRFGSVAVLRGVDLDLNAGEVLILAGENGAGKSTLIKILGGVYPDYEGEIELDGRAIRPRSPLEAAALGIAIIFQELSLVPTMTVADNIFLGRPLTRQGFVDDAAQRAAARELLEQLGLDLDVDRRVEDLPLAQQQLTEIAKALARQARVIVMDEPTSALGAPEVEKLFALIGDLQARGCAVVYITHKMEEIRRIGDRITVLRDGELVGSAPAEALPPERLVQWMVGRQMDDQFPRHASRPGPPRLQVENLTVWPHGRDRKAAVEGISFTLHAGEIVGVAGLQGSGASDLLGGLFGAFGSAVEGRAWLDGCALEIAAPRRAIEQGLAWLTNDRKATGLVLPLSIIANTTLADLRRLTPGGWRSPVREAALAREQGARLSLRAASLSMEVGYLSGGNQQKVVLAKWLLTRPRVLLCDEPTRGIDVGAKREIYELMNQLTAEGVTILLITSELPELLALSDRILVLHRGRLTATLDRAQASPERVLAAAMGDV